MGHAGTAAAHAGPHRAAAVRGTRAAAIPRARERQRQLTRTASFRADGLAPTRGEAVFVRPIGKHRLRLPQGGTP
ncbi:hypothetical protein GCM10007918_09100 [Piscinibacter gummiphilus]|nr:hypothetical protein GCM10007918_09100 [Piscinibacter gummiphilus]